MKYVLAIAIAALLAACGTRTPAQQEYVDAQRLCSHQPDADGCADFYRERHN
jgi:uncharacterized lipoprotein YmbA